MSERNTSDRQSDRKPVVVAPTLGAGALDPVKIAVIWCCSSAMNITLIVLAYLLFSALNMLPGAELPPEPEAPAPAQLEDAPPPEKDLTNLDIGLDSTVPLNYNVDRIEDVSVPGRVDPTAPVGILNAPEAAPMNVSPPPGFGGGTGAARFDPTSAGAGSMAGTVGGMGGMYNLGGFGGRSGSTRQKMLQEGGGNNISEAAVAAGLGWLAKHQAQDGHWSLHQFNKHARTAPLPGGRVMQDNSTPQTTRNNDIAGTAFGLLPYLAAGITNKPPRKRQDIDYHKTVAAGLRFLMSRQQRSGKDAGYFGGDMYAHGLATITMCEAYGLTSDPMLKGSAQMAIRYTLSAQHEGGGWRYAARTPGDTSVTGWHLMGLKSAQMAGLSVPRASLKACERFLNSVEVDKGKYSYVPGGGPTYTMTSVGLLCRQYLGVNPRNPNLLAGIRYLKQFPPTQAPNMYYLYYATQVMHHMGGEAWEFWNLGPEKNGKGGIREYLIARQDKTGREGNRGSWPVGGGSAAGGRMMSTSLSLLTLEVYYRHLPLYRRDSGVVKDK